MGYLQEVQNKALLLYRNLEQVLYCKILSKILPTNDPTGWILQQDNYNDPSTERKKRGNGWITIYTPDWMSDWVAQSEPCRKHVVNTVFKSLYQASF